MNLSFITANYVGRALNYAGPNDWAPNDAATIEKASPEGFLAVVQDVVQLGFEAVDVWTAHCHWLRHDREDYLEQVKGFCSQFDLTITSYAGGFEAKSAADVEAVFRFMKQLGAPIFAGGIHGLPSPELCAVVNAACHKYGVRWACENHPGEKSLDDILARIDNGRHDRVGVALDTGWAGTMGFDPVDAALRLAAMNKLTLVHLKDVKAAGAHVTCTLGDGIVPVEKVVKELKRAGWAGTLCVEHEPYDHDPTAEIATSTRRVREWLK
ncbi:MAG: sugar phosphate isomerase/epimerase family protein [Phycisphaerae bacterium]|nr:sugar phosphate isomerase/epimerase family protein [Tepidisphaeraceae bacterium]